jgi:hypothetical protein
MCAHLGAAIKVFAVGESRRSIASLEPATSLLLLLLFWYCCLWRQTTVNNKRQEEQGGHMNKKRGF